MSARLNRAPVIRWIRPVAQAATRSVRPGVGDTGASSGFGAHPLIPVLGVPLAMLFVGMPRTFIASPQGISAAGLPIFARCLAASQLFCPFAVCHFFTPVWHAVYKNVATPLLSSVLQCVAWRCMALHGVASCAHRIGLVDVQLLMIIKKTPQ